MAIRKDVEPRIVSAEQSQGSIIKFPRASERFSRRDLLRISAASAITAGLVAGGALPYKTIDDWRKREDVRLDQERLAIIEMIAEYEALQPIVSQTAKQVFNPTNFNDLLQPLPPGIDKIPEVTV